MQSSFEGCAYIHKHFYTWIPCDVSHAHVMAYVCFFAMLEACACLCRCKGTCSDMYVLACMLVQRVCRYDDRLARAGEPLHGCVFVVDVLGQCMPHDLGFTHLAYDFSAIIHVDCGAFCHTIASAGMHMSQVCFGWKKLTQNLFQYHWLFADEVK
jgi:hypothetical protein